MILIVFILNQLKAVIPWDGLSWNEIQDELIKEKKSLPVDFTLIPLPFSRIIKDGFSLNAMHRMSFDEVKLILDTHLQSLNAQRYVMKKKQQQQFNYDENINSKEIACLNNNNLESDKFSQMSSTSNGDFIYCDSYKTEVHLTNKNPNVIRSSSSAGVTNNKPATNTRLV